MKKALSILLTLSLLFSCLPAIALAEPIGGSCGENVTWSFDAETGVLTVSGTGAMEDYDGRRIVAPWSDYSINTIILSEGITRIGNYAFNQSSVKEVTLNNNLQEIGAYAFYNCYSLTAITIPASVTAIGQSAFESCFNLQSITVDEQNESYISVDDVLFSADMKTLICYPSGKTGDYEVPEGVTILSDRAFSLLYNILAISIPASVSSIGDIAISGFCITAINVDESNDTFASVDGVLFSKDMKTLIAFPSARTGEYTVPDDVERIAGSAFSNAQLSGIALNVELEEIGLRAFNNCDSFTEITIPDKVKTIGSQAFAYCNNLKTITIGRNVRKIEDSAFTGSPIEAVTFGGTEERWNEINIANGNDALKSASISFQNQEPDPAAVIASGSCGENVTWSLDDDGILTISGTGAMADYDWNTMPWYSYKNDINTIVINEGVTRIGNNAFYQSKVSKAMLNNDLQVIGTDAFWNCSSLSTVAIPANVTTIGDGAFAYCYNLKSFTADEQNTAYKSVDGILFSADMKTLIYFPASRTGEYSVPETVERIANYAFNGSRLSAITLNEGTQEIGTAAFNSCSSLTAIVIPDGVRTISSIAFVSCSNLKSVTIGKNVRKIESQAFDYCPIETVTFGGTEERWNAISIASGNDTLKNASISFLGEAPDPAAVIASGSCGENATWSLDEDGVLTISGTGAMADYDWGEAPWHEKKDDIRSIIIDEGITTIGNNAFASEFYLKSISIPNSLLTIGNSSFIFCKALELVVLPKNLTEIGSQAFYGCSSISNLSLQDSMRTIKDYAFANCSNLKTVTLGKNVRRIESSAFAGCPIETVTFGGTQERWNSINIASGNDTLKSASTSFLNQEPDPAAVIASGSCGENVTWSLDEDGTLTISGTGAMADYSSNTMPWYSYKSSIVRINVQDGITRIGDNGFYNFYNASTVTLPETLISIGNYALASCGKLSSATLPSNVTEIGSWAFMSCYSLTAITLPNGLRSISTQTFAYCNSLKTVTIGKNVREIESSVFSNCPLETVTYGGTEEQWNAVSINYGNDALTNAAFTFMNQEPDPPAGYCGDNITWSLDEETGVLTISGEGEMLSHPWSAYSDAIKSIVVSDGVTTICNSAFWGLREVTDVDLPSTLISIGENAFTNCDSITTFTIPEGVTTVGNYAFSASDSLQYLFIPSTVTKISGFDLLGALKYIFVDANNPAYVSRNGALYTKDMSTLICRPARFNGKYIIPNGVTTIESGALFWCHINSVHIPSSVTYIGISAFEACSWLSTVYYEGSEEDWAAIEGTGKPSANNITFVFNATLDASEMIPDNACGDNLTWSLGGNGVLTISGTGDMYDYKSSTLPWAELSEFIREIVIEDGVTSIGDYAFYRCTNATSVTIPEGVTKIGTYAFYGCSALTAVNLPSSLDSISDRAFYACSGLTTITIPDGVESIGDRVFNGCKALETIYISSGVNSIGSYVFGNCSSLINISVSEENAAFSSLNGALYNKEKTELLCCPAGYEGSFTVPDTVTAISGEAFSSCQKLTSVDIPAAVSVIGDWAFEGCTLLSRINAASENTVFASLNGVLYTKDMKKIVCCPAGYSGEYTIPDGVEAIGNAAFYNCASLTAITIPDGVTSIGNWAFGYCRALTSLDIPESVTSIGNSAFSDCEAVKSFKIPEGVTRIEGRTFFNCYALQSITIPSSVAVIDKAAFNYCNALKDIYFAGTEEQWEAISINEYDREELLTAKQHFADSFTAMMSDGEITVVASEMSGSVFAAAYDKNGRFLGISDLSVQKSGKISGAENASYVKFFSVDADFRPTSAAKTISVEASYTYKDAVYAMATNWNPHTYSTSDDSYPADFLRSGLYSFVYNDELHPVEGKDPYSGYKVIPEMAADMPVDVTVQIREQYPQFNIPEDADSGYAYTIDLNPNACWEDGTPINADTYVYSMERLLSPKLKNYRASDYYTGSLVIAGAEAYANAGGTSCADSAATYGYTMSDFTLGKNGQYIGPNGEKMYIGLDYPLKWCSGKTLKYYVDAYGEFYFDLTNWATLAAMMDDNGLIPLTDENLALFTPITCSKPAWGETEADLPNYFVTGVDFPVIDYDGNVGCFKSGEYQITLVFGKSLKDFALLYNLTSNWIVKEDIYEASLSESEGVWSSTYNTSVETTSSYGPYKLTVYKPGNLMRFEKNENWYGWTDELHKYVDPSDGKTYRMYQTNAIECRTGGVSFFKGELMTYSLQNDDFALYRNSDYAYFTPSETIYFLILNGYEEAIEQRESAEDFDTATRDLQMLLNLNFRKAIAVTYDKELFCSTLSPARSGGYGLLGESYIYDIDSGALYRDTDQAKMALVSFYSVDLDAFNGDLDAAVASITGYDPETAKTLFAAAFAEGLEAGYINDADSDGVCDQSILIEYALSSDSDFMTATIEFLNDKMAEVTIGTPFEGKIQFVKSTPYGNEWSNKIRNGLADTVIGGWSGSALDPYGITDVYVNPSKQYDGMWFDATKHYMTLTVAGQEVTLSLKQWSDALNGNTVTAKGIEYNFGEGRVSVDDRLAILAGFETAILSTYDYIPMMQNAKAILLSKQAFYVVKEYNPIMGRGGIAYLKYNYDDAAWAEYVASQGGTVNYR